MATKITTCDKCGSSNITVLNPELIETSPLPIVRIDAKCNECNTIFKFPSATKSGKRKGILY